MARRPGDRYPTAEALSRDVRQWLAGEPVTAWREPLTAKAVRWVRKNQVAATATAVLVVVSLVLGSAGAVWVQQREEQEHRERVARQEQERLIRLAHAEKGKATIEQAAEMRKRMRWREAQVLLEQARVAVNEAQDTSLQEKLQQAEGDLVLVRDLDRVREENGGMAALIGEEVKDPFPEVFKKHGLDVLEGSVEALAERIRSSAVRNEILAALDNWVLIAALGDKSAGQQRFKRLMDLVLLVDRENDWRKQLLDAVAAPSVAVKRKRVLVLLEQFKEKSPAPATAMIVAMMLGGPNNPEAETFLKEILQRNPDDFWLNFELATWLQVLPGKEYVEERDRSRLEEAIGYFRAATALKPGSAWVYTFLGAALRTKGDKEGALRAYQQAVRLEPGSGKLHFLLGQALWAKRDKEGAMRSLREAIRLDPTFGLPHGALGDLLLADGDFAGALSCFQQAAQLLPATDPLSRYTAQRLDLCRQMLEGEEILNDVLAGKPLPKDPRRLVTVAELACRPTKQLYSTAVRLYTAAFDAQPDLTELRFGVRYRAACAAARAGTGQGKDVAGLDNTAKAHLRSTALSWLENDLKAHIRQLDSWWPGAAKESRQALLRWREDADLAAVRDRASLRKLPEVEQTSWRSLWTQVDALLARNKPGK
jgi:tetratricopeptide (TPR) repeat protein